MPLPTKAKMTALVCRGRKRPKVNQGPRLKEGYTSWMAIIMPTSIPTIPQMKEAAPKARVILLSY